VSYVVTYAAGFVTLGLALYAVWMISLLVARPAEEIGELSIFARLKALATPPPDVAVVPLVLSR
jgi:hypothetical protein